MKEMMCEKGAKPPTQALLEEPVEVASSDELHLIESELRDDMGRPLPGSTLVERIQVLKRHNDLLRAVAGVAADLEPHLARLFGGPLLDALDAAREGGAL